MTNIEKIKISNDDQRFYSLIGQEAQPATLNQKWYQILQSLEGYLHAKNTDSFLPKILITKGHCNLIA